MVGYEWATEPLSRVSTHELGFQLELFTRMNVSAGTVAQDADSDAETPKQGDQAEADTLFDALVDGSTGVGGEDGGNDGQVFAARD